MGETPQQTTRRGVLGTTALAGTGSLAGCAQGDQSAATESTATERTTRPATSEPTTRPPQQQAPTSAAVTVLTADMSAAEARSAIENGSYGDRFLIETGATWTLSETLEIPMGVDLIGKNGKRRTGPTFKKGFDGPLARIRSWNTLQGIFFHGNRQAGYGGHCVVTAKNCREVQTRGCYFRYAAGSGFVPRKHYQSRHVLDGFDNNEGFGVKHEQHHHTNLHWDTCHLGRNGRGAIHYGAVDISSRWYNCPIGENRGPAVLFDLPDDYPQGNRPIHQILFEACLLQENAGPAMLARGGRGWGIVFEDCKVKSNAHPGLVEELDESYALPEDLTEPIGGFVHLEDATYDVEARGVQMIGGVGTDGTSYRATGNVSRELQFHVSGAIRTNGVAQGMADIIGPETLLTVPNTGQIADESTVSVKAGWGGDPKQGSVQF